MGTRATRPCGIRYGVSVTVMYLGLEIFYIGLLILAVLAILAVASVVLYNLFRGQR